MAKNATTSPADLSALGINAERAAEVASQVLMPNAACYVVLTGFDMTPPDKDTGSSHAVFSLSVLDLPASLDQGKLVPQTGAFEMQCYDIGVPGAKVKESGKSTFRSVGQDDKDKAEIRRTDMLGILCRAAGVTPSNGQGYPWFVSGIQKGEILPVGIFNPSTNGPDLQDSYVKDNVTKTFSVKDYGEFNFRVTTPSLVLEAIGVAATKLKNAGVAISQHSLTDALAIPDTRQYAKLAKARGRGVVQRQTPIGGGQAPAGFGNMGDAPPES